ncbi:uncharacterized protein IL334_006372 [Kwoniella shivajii]|uniref:Uncharacterized protein n=1 Tax=Kwoniella shivajii TaxID=564305 RepID=A0ABZ1D6F8_9TREE|nr:hypothetical protein IL334_006372 [Kwoniella shivajii]
MNRPSLSHEQSSLVGITRINEKNNIQDQSQDLGQDQLQDQNQPQLQDPNIAGEPSSTQKQLDRLHDNHDQNEDQVSQQDSRFSPVLNDTQNDIYPSPDIISIGASPQYPTTPAIPSLDLPVPLISLPTHIPSEARSIPILRPREYNGIDRSIPNSIKDLKGLMNSLEYTASRYSTSWNLGQNSTSIGSTTVRPGPESNIVGSLGQATIKPRQIQVQDQDQSVDSTIRPRMQMQMPGSLSFDSRMKSFQAEFLAQKSSSSDDERRSSGSPAQGMSRRDKEMIDEVEVEWCFFCGKEKIRDGMELQQVNMTEIPRIYRAAEIKSNHLQEEERETSWQWVCNDCGDSGGDKG